MGQNHLKAIAASDVGEGDRDRRAGRGDARRAGAIGRGAPRRPRLDARRGRPRRRARVRAERHAPRHRASGWSRRGCRSCARSRSGVIAVGGARGREARGRRAGCRSRSASGAASCRCCKQLQGADRRRRARRHLRRSRASSGTGSRPARTSAPTAAASSSTWACTSSTRRGGSAGQEFVRHQLAGIRRRSRAVAGRPGERPRAGRALAAAPRPSISLGRRFPLGDVCKVEVFGTKGWEECRFLWPPTADETFFEALKVQAGIVRAVRARRAARGRRRRGCRSCAGGGGTSRGQAPSGRSAA